MAVQMQSLSADELMASQSDVQSTQSLKSKIQQTREIQLQRQTQLNARLSVQELQRVAHTDSATKKLLQQTSSQWGWSARAWHRTLRVARTIADLDQAEALRIDHVSEAIELRRAMDVQ